MQFQYLILNKDIKISIEQDDVGWYLIIYENAHSNCSTEDYLFDSFSEALEFAGERFDVSKSEWKINDTIS